MDLVDSVGMVLLDLFQGLIAESCSLTATSWSFTNKG